MLCLVRIDCGDDIDASGLVKRRRPFVGCAVSKIAKFQRAFGHPFDELGRECREMLRWRPQGAKPIIGHTDVEAHNWLQARTPLRRARDRWNVGAVSLRGPGEKTPRRRTVNDLKDEIAHPLEVIAPQDIALNVVGVERRASPPQSQFLADLRGRKTGIGTIAPTQRNIGVCVQLQDQFARQRSEFVGRSVGRIPFSASCNANRSVGKSGAWNRSCACTQSMKSSILCSRGDERFPALHLRHDGVEDAADRRDEIPDVVAEVAIVD